MTRRKRCPSISIFAASPRRWKRGRFCHSLPDDVREDGGRRFKDAKRRQIEDGLGGRRPRIGTNRNRAFLEGLVGVFSDHAEGPLRNEVDILLRVDRTVSLLQKDLHRHDPGISRLQGYRQVIDGFRVNRRRVCRTLSSPWSHRPCHPDQCQKGAHSLSSVRIRDDASRIRFHRKAKTVAAGGKKIRNELLLRRILLVVAKEHIHAAVD